MALHRVDGPSGPQGPHRPGRTPAPKVTDSTGTGSGDRIELSVEARRIAALSEAAAGLPEVRMEKVEPLRQALADGTYSPDPRAVARAILEFEDGLPG